MFYISDIVIENEFNIHVVFILYVCFNQIKSKYNDDKHIFIVYLFKNLILSNFKATYMSTDR